MKRILVILMVILLVVIMLGCERQSDIVSKNLSEEADNFNVIRQITVINAIQGDVVFQMTGRLSIEQFNGKLEVVVEHAAGQYAKHFFFVGDNGIVMVEQQGYADIDQYNYTLNYNPKMWLPVKPVIID